MSRAHDDRRGCAQDGGHAASAMDPGKRTASERLPVQRKAAVPAPAAATAAPAGAPASAVDDPFAMHLPVQRKANTTGLPDQLKTGIESLSGMSMDHVQVHRDSDRPARVDALAFAQGSEIHLGPGQEQHLPHEAWHVMQQAQGRVAPTQQMKRDGALNDDAALEAEADEMGARAMQVASPAAIADAPRAAPVAQPVVQRLKGAPGTKQANKTLEFTLNDEFVTKHVATDLENAKAVTQARIDTGGPPSMVAGTLANHMATEKTWTDAIKASTALVPPEGKWTSDCGDDGPEFVNQLASVTVTGWEGQGTSGNVAAKASTFTRYVGGHWTVSDCEDADDGGFKDGTGNVTVDISHLTS